MITTLFFDFAGVVATTKLFPKLAEIISRKTNVPAEKIERALYADAECFVCGDQNTEDFWKEHLEPLGIELSMFESEMQTWYTLRTDLLTYIDQLRKRGFVAHILSDNFDVCTKVMRNDNLFTSHFENLYFSNEIHLSKSGTDFFIHALKDANVTAEESLFIDDKEKNVAMAEKIGLRGLVFNDTESFKVDLESILKQFSKF